VDVTVAAGAALLLAWAAAAPLVRADENVEQAFILQHFRLERGVESAFLTKSIHKFLESLPSK
jgi:hypothetical protein